MTRKKLSKSKIITAFRKEEKKVNNKRYIPLHMRQNDLYQEAIMVIFQNGSPYLIGINNDYSMSVQLNFSSLEAAALFLNIITDANDPNTCGKLTKQKYVEQQLVKYASEEFNNMFYFTMRINFDDTLKNTTPGDGYCGWSVIEQTARRQKEKSNMKKDLIRGLDLPHRAERNCFLKFWRNIVPDIKETSLLVNIQGMIKHAELTGGNP